ncbi:MAG TPA: AI-2E family transporter [Verrucomicrobiae bacterium]|nr:AI-2E family transporter [Verrucomicrobiae bacterium]
MKSFAAISPPGENRPRESAALNKKTAQADSGLVRLTKIAEILAIILGSIAFAYFARSVVLPLMLAWVASMTLKPPVTWLRNSHFPAPLAAAIVLGIFLVGIGFGAMWLGRPAAQWVKSAPEKIPQLQEKFKNILQPVMRFSAAAARVGSMDAAQNSTNAVPTVAVKDNHMIGAMYEWTSSLFAGIGGAIVLTFLLLASGDTFMQKLANTIPDRQHKKRAVEISREIQHSISGYLFTVSVINTGVGCIAGTLFWLLGMPSPAMWGGVVAVLNFLPFFGPTVGMVLVGLAGLIAFDTVGGALLPVAAYLLLHLVESYLVTPFALGQRFSLNRVMIFVAFIFCAWLWGVAGALLAVPLLMSLKIVCERVPGLSPAAEFLSD